MYQITDFIVSHYPLWFLFWMVLCTIGLFAERRLPKGPNEIIRHVVSIASSIAGILAFAPFLYMIYDAAPIEIKPKLRGIGIVLLLVLPTLIVYLAFGTKKKREK
ncbi:MAG: hypothetical protein PHC70_00405 [Patescibacteria group bacterium]|nr:hypothetical protein [Patescibacteria group bacterium]